MPNEEKDPGAPRSRSYVLVDSGHDEYPGDGLRMRALAGGPPMDKEFLRDMGMDLRAGDEVEVTVRLVSRLETRRVPT